MLHARKDYDRIQDPWPPEQNGIHPDEPVFLLRAQDKVAATTVRIWALLAKEAGASDEMVQSALKQADRMDEWESKFIPDMPEGAGK